MTCNKKHNIPTLLFIFKIKQNFIRALLIFTKYYFDNENVLNIN